MGRYHTTSADVEATQWFPGLALTIAGRTVVPYARPDVSSTAPCTTCKNLMSSHGWLPEPPPPVDPAIATLPVDPVTGKVVVPPAPAVVRYTKPGAPDIVASTPGVEASAISAGYVAAPIAPSSPGFVLYYAKPGAPDLFPTTAAEVKSALADGYVAVTAPQPGATNPGGLPLYVKPGAPDIVAATPADETMAIAEGYALAVPLPVPVVPVPAPIPAPAFAPRVYTKPGLPGIFAATAAEEDSAIAQGYVLLEPEPLPTGPLPPGTTPKPPVLDPKRKDLKGLVVHPKYWVVQPITGGEITVVSPDQFAFDHPRLVP